MELSTFALWLNSFFMGYDTAILSLMHKLAEKMGGLFTPLMKLITVLGEKGILLFLFALICMCFPRTRPLGVCVFGAVCCGALITNIILKDMVARPRPFETVEQFRQWWQFIGAPAEDDFSFPSGHVTAAASGFMAICLMRGKKWVTPSVIIVLLMGISRNYLMAHYPSDVLFALIIGAASGVIAWFITLAIFNFMAQREKTPAFALIMDFDIRESVPGVKKAADSIGRILNNLGIRPASKPAPAKVRESYTEEYEDEEEVPSYRPRRSAAPTSRGAQSSRQSAAKFGSYRSGSVGYKGRHEK